MANLTGHFEAVVRGRGRWVSFVYDCDDEEGCYECVDVEVHGVVLTHTERTRLVGLACDIALHQLWCERPRRGPGLSA
jgi:hypothetical protein